VLKWRVAGKGGNGAEEARKAAPAAEEQKNGRLCSIDIKILIIGNIIDK